MWGMINFKWANIQTKRTTFSCNKSGIDYLVYLYRASGQCDDKKVITDELISNGNVLIDVYINCMMYPVKTGCLNGLKSISNLSGHRRPAPHSGRGLPGERRRLCGGFWEKRSATQSDIQVVQSWLWRHWWEGRLDSQLHYVYEWKWWIGKYSVNLFKGQFMAYIYLFNHQDCLGRVAEFWWYHHRDVFLLLDIIELDVTRLVVLKAPKKCISLHPGYSR